MNIATSAATALPRDRIAEFTDLGEADRTVLIEEAQRRRISSKATRGAETINLGALSIVLRQFHFHVVARFADDPNWPGSAS